MEVYQPQHGGRHNRHAIRDVTQLTTALAEGCAVIDEVDPIRGAAQLIISSLSRTDHGWQACNRLTG